MINLLQKAKELKSQVLNAFKSPIKAVANIGPMVKALGVTHEMSFQGGVPSNPDLNNGFPKDAQYPPVQSNQDIKNTKDTVFKAFPFTTAAHQTIDEAKIGILKSKEHLLLKENVGADGEMRPKGSDFKNFIMKYVDPFSPKASDFIINHTNFLQNLDAANIDITTTDPTVLAHEMLHQVFDSSVMTANNLSPNSGQNAEGFGNRFLDTWDKVAKKNIDSPLSQIDDRINADYNTGDMAGSDLATERFAYLGELVGQYGLSVIPKELRPYYIGVFDNKSKPTPFKATHYDPWDPKQTRPNSKGIGSFGKEVVFGDVAVPQDSKMVKGTLVLIPELKDIKTPYGMGIFRVNDRLNKRFNGQSKLDIALPHGGTKELRNRIGSNSFNYQVVE